MLGDEVWLAVSVPVSSQRDGVAVRALCRASQVVSNYTRPGFVHRSIVMFDQESTEHKVTRTPLQCKSALKTCFLSLYFCSFGECSV